MVHENITTSSVLRNNLPIDYIAQSDICCSNPQSIFEERICNLEFSIKSLISILENISNRRDITEYANSFLSDTNKKNSKVLSGNSFLTFNKKPSVIKIDEISDSPSSLINCFDSEKSRTIENRTHLLHDLNDAAFPQLQNKILSSGLLTSANACSGSIVNRNEALSDTDIISNFGKGTLDLENRSTSDTVLRNTKSDSSLFIQRFRTYLESYFQIHEHSLDSHKCSTMLSALEDTKLCKFHIKFGSKARKCDSKCNWSQIATDKSWSDLCANHTKFGSKTKYCSGICKFFELSDANNKNQDRNISYCPATYDQVLCWKPIEGGKHAIQPCPTEFSGHTYNNYENAEKYCFSNGTWERRANYESCYKLSQDNSVLFWLYIIGYSLSFVSLCSAFVIFSYFKSLRCLRNIIHCNLILSFIIRVILWILVYASTFSKPYPQVVSNILFALNISFQLANFFWMFVEGLYLFIVIVWTYRIEKVKIWHFTIIGWAVPSLLTSIWVVVMVTENINDWVAYPGKTKLIVHLPIILILVVNAIVLLFIVITLIDKLKATKNQQLCNRRNNSFGPLTNEYKKALKSTVVLMPLLGFSHIIFICSPSESKFTVVFNIINAILSSSQGFWVSLIYCFFNGEVQTTLRNHLFKCARFQNNIRTRHTICNIPSHRQSVPLFNQQMSDTAATTPFDNHKQIVSLMQKLKQSKDPQNRMNNNRRVRSQMNIREPSDISLM